MVRLLLTVFFMSKPRPYEEIRQHLEHPQNDRNRKIFATFCNSCCVVKCGSWLQYWNDGAPVLEYGEPLDVPGQPHHILRPQHLIIYQSCRERGRTEYPAIYGFSIAGYPPCHIPCIIAYQKRLDYIRPDMRSIPNSQSFSYLGKRRTWH